MWGGGETGQEQCVSCRMVVMEGSGSGSGQWNGGGGMDISDVRLQISSF